MTEPTDITGQQQAIPDGGMTFERRKSDSAIWFWLGGFGCILWAAVGMTIAIMADVDQLQLHALTTLPLILSVMCFITAYAKRRSPHRITVDKDGLTLDGKGSMRRLTWDLIGWTDVDTAPMTHQRQLTLYAPDGKVITRIVADFEGFEVLKVCLAERIRARNDGVAERIERKKNRKQGWLLTCLGPVFILLAIANAWIIWDEQRAETLMATQSVEGEARILRQFVAPNGRTKRIEYEITTAEGLTGTHNAEVEPEVWSRLQDAKTVQVRYVPSEPSISRLAVGEIDSELMDGSPLLMYGLSAVMGLFGLLGAAVGILFLNGIDIEQRIKDRFTSRAV